MTDGVKNGGLYYTFNITTNWTKKTVLKLYVEEGLSEIFIFIAGSKQLIYKADKLRNTVSTISILLRAMEVNTPKQKYGSS